MDTNASSLIWIQRIDKLLWWGLIAFCFSLLLSTFVAEAIVVLMIILWMIKLAFDKKRFWVKTALDIPIVAFAGSQLLSIIMSINPLMSAGRLRKLFFIAIYPLVVQNFRQLRGEKIRRLIQVLLVGAVTVAVIGIAKYLLHLDVRASSTVAGYSALATHLAVAIALGLGIRVHSRIFSRRGVDEIFLGIMLVGLALTFSRGQWLAVAVVILLVGVWKSPKMLAAVAAAALGLLMIFPELRLRAMTLLDPLNQSSERLTIWKGAILLFNERPFFGFGLDTFRAVFPLMHEMKDKGVGSWHNDYLQVLVESGLVGLAIFLCLAGVLLYRSLSLYRRLNGTHDQAKGLSLGIFLTFVTFFTAIFFSSILIGPLAFMLFAFIMGLFAVLDEQEKNISKPYEV